MSDIVAADIMSDEDLAALPTIHPTFLDAQRSVVIREMIDRARKSHGLHPGRSLRIEDAPEWVKSALRQQFGEDALEQFQKHAIEQERKHQRAVRLVRGEEMTDTDIVPVRHGAENPEPAELEVETGPPEAIPADAAPAEVVQGERAPGFPLAA